MERDDIRYLLGGTIFERAEAYTSRVQDIDLKVGNNGERHWKAKVYGSRGHVYNTQVWLRQNGTYVSSSCTCPYNSNGDGPCCKHIGALLLSVLDMETAPAAAPKAKLLEGSKIGLMTGAELARRQAAQADDYNAALGMMFGSKWRQSEPASDNEALELLSYYRDNAAELDQPLPDRDEPRGSIILVPMIELNSRDMPLLSLSITDGGRTYSVRSIDDLLDAVEHRREVKYGKELAFRHCAEAFEPASRRLLNMLRRQQAMRQSVENDMRGYWGGRAASTGAKGSVRLTGEGFDELFNIYNNEKFNYYISGYELCEGIPEDMTLKASRKRGGVQVELEPEMGVVSGLEYDYAFDSQSLWRMSKSQSARILPALRMLGGNCLFLAAKDIAAFCSYVLPELGGKVKIDDPERLLLNRIPLEALVQFYLDVPREGAVMAHAEFVYGEDRVTPFAPAPKGLLRDMRAETRAARLLQSYLTAGEDGNPAVYSTDTEDEVYRFLDDGVPALMAEGEVYLTDAFRRMQAAPPKISVGVSVHGSVLDLDVNTGDFPLEELHALMQSVRSKKRYHRLRDGRLLKIDSSLDALEELDETLELSGANLEQAHAQLPLYRAPTLDRALSGQQGVYFNRDDAFRRISRSFHAVKDSDYVVPQELQSVLRKYQRDGYRWLRTLDGYGMGGILADDMGLGKTLQVLTYLLAIKEERGAGEAALPSLIVCPASLVLNWAEECRRFTPQLNCVPVDGTAARRAELAERWAGADLVVTSYDLLRRDKDLYAKQGFYACILDEAQAVKNHATQKYKAVCGVNSRVRFALTGTPVENRLGELWSIFSFLMPGYLPPYKSFCARFEKPIALSSDENAARRLNQLTGPFILRRMKAEVLKELPPKTESVYRIDLETEQRKLYLAAVVDAREKLRAAKPDDKIAVFAVLMRLREICCDPRLVAEGWAGGSAKLDACMELVSSAVESGHRILLFSQFTSMLELLAKRLDEEDISHFTLQGSTPKPVRAELVRRFNDGEASVFLISLRAGGTGLNLTAADIVIHYDPWWNVAAQNQATDRAYRIGQQNPVQVYKLIAQDTIEEKILELQQVKQTLAETVTGSADGAILSMKPEELLALLENE